MNSITEMHTEEWIQHEVQLRVHDARFTQTDTKIDELRLEMKQGFIEINSRFHTLYISMICACIIPTTISIAVSIIMHYIK